MRFFIRLALASSVLGGAYAWPVLAAQEDGLNSLSGAYLAGRSAGRLRDVELAAGYVEQALKLDPANAQLTERLFQFRLSEGSLKEAEKLAMSVIKINSQQRMARVVLGLKDLRDGHGKAAREHFSEAAYTPIGELTAALLKAWSYAGENNLNAALKELAKLDSNESFANFKSFHEALITDFLKSDVRADAAYKKAYGVAGSSLRVTQAYANYLLRKGHKAEAEKVYGDFLAKSEGNVIIVKALADLKAGAGEKSAFVPDATSGAGEALFSLAAAMNDQESADVALLYANLALAYGADKPVLVTLAGDINADLERYDAAIAAYDRVPASSALKPSSEIQISLNLQRMGRTKEAQDRLATLLAKDPGYLEGWTTLGNIHRNNESYRDAAEAYSRAIDLMPKNSPDWQLYYHRGICLERLKDWPKAEADFRTALKLVPEESSVLNYLGYSLIDRKEKVDEAFIMVKKAVDLKPNDGYIVDSLGWAYFQTGRFEDALPQLERAVDLKAGDPIIAEHLGDVYWRVDRKLEAKFQWQHAKDNKPDTEDLKRIEDKLQNGLPDAVPAADDGKSKSSTNG